jgi:hypothetical protein
MQGGVELGDGGEVGNSNIGGQFGISYHEGLLRLVYRVIDGKDVLNEDTSVYPEYDGYYLASATL